MLLILAFISGFLRARAPTQMKCSMWPSASICVILNCKLSEFAHDERISQNTKYEARNSKQIRNENDQYPKQFCQATRRPRAWVWNIWISDLSRISSFYIRIWLRPRASLFRRMQSAKSVTTCPAFSCGSCARRHAFPRQRSLTVLTS